MVDSSVNATASLSACVRMYFGHLYIHTCSVTAGAYAHSRMVYDIFFRIPKQGL